MAVRWVGRCCTPCVCLYREIRFSSIGSPFFAQFCWPGAREQKRHACEYREQICLMLRGVPLEVSLLLWSHIGRLSVKSRHYLADDYWTLRNRWNTQGRSEGSSSSTKTRIRFMLKVLAVIDSTLYLTWNTTWFQGERAYFIIRFNIGRTVCARFERKRTNWFYWCGFPCSLAWLGYEQRLTVSHVIWLPACIIHDRSLQICLIKE